MRYSTHWVGFVVRLGEAAPLFRKSGFSAYKSEPRRKNYPVKRKINESVGKFWKIIWRRLPVENKRTGSLSKQIPSYAD